VSESADDLPRDRGRITRSLNPDADCAIVTDLASGFVFGALDPEERHTVERHCLLCPPCAKLVEQGRQTAALLSFVAHPVKPPAHVKAALFARIAQASAAAATVQSTSLPLMPAAVGAVPSPPETRSAGRRPSFPRLNWDLFGGSSRRAWPAVAAPLAAVPLVLALAIVGGFALTARSQVDSLRDDLAVSQGESEKLRETLDAMDGFIASDDAQVYSLPANTRGTSSPYGKVVVNPGSTQAMLVVWKMKATPNNGGYQVFLENHMGQRYPAAQFRVDRSGYGIAMLNLDRPLTAYESVHVVPISQTTDIESLVGSIGPIVGSPYDTGPPPTE
jgi:hypothetical protein